MRKLGLLFVRYGIPLAMVIVGIVAYEGGGLWEGFGVVLMGFAVTVLGINVLFRLSLVSNRDRDVEEAARDYFELHGHWPDER